MLCKCTVKSELNLNNNLVELFVALLKILASVVSIGEKPLNA